MVKRVDLSAIFIDVVVSNRWLGSLVNHCSTFLLDSVRDCRKRVRESTNPEWIILRHVPCWQGYPNSNLELLSTDGIIVRLDLEAHDSL